ncbi:hypothetical protein TUM16655_01020 [Enterobacter cloacae]|uniref:Uncharacterized protein n=1 Tax=Enterobacter roggenkampii TaxID=1812935 RepID=A0AAU9BCT7_9ENTR|nr:hypothetical protein OIPHN260_19240 [Enterobacter roggenkampii]GJJ96653.1 hypothetical protein TUM16655_01020 [Enterobacter cloacae]
MQGIAVECPPSLRVTKVVTHKPRFSLLPEASIWDSAKIEYTIPFTFTAGATGTNS